MDGFRKARFGLTKYVISGSLSDDSVSSGPCPCGVFRKSLFLGAGLVYSGRFQGGSFFGARLFFGLCDVVGFSWGGVMRFPLFSFLLAALIVFVWDGLVWADFRPLRGSGDGKFLFFLL